MIEIKMPSSKQLILFPGPGLDFRLLHLFCFAIGSLAAPYHTELSILNCSPRENTTRFPPSFNESGFLALPENTVCVEGDLVELYCSPQYHDSTFWILWNNTAQCFADGNQTINGSTLVLPCGSYTLQCVSSGVYSRPIKISRDIVAVDPTVEKCHEGQNNTVSFNCPAIPDEVITTRWFLGDEISPSEYVSMTLNSRRLDVPCIQKYNNTKIWCQVELRAGVVNKTAGRLLLYPGESRPQTDAEKNSYTEQPYLIYITLTAGQVKIIAAALFVLASITISCFLVFGLYNCIQLRRNRAKVQTEGTEKPNGNG